MLLLFSQNLSLVFGSPHGAVKPGVPLVGVSPEPCAGLIFIVVIVHAVRDGGGVLPWRGLLGLQPSYLSEQSDYRHPHRHALLSQRRK